MKYSQLFTIAALLSVSVSAIRIEGKGKMDMDIDLDTQIDTNSEAESLMAIGADLDDDSDPNGKNVDGAETYADQKISGYNGADEDEIMDNIFGKYSKEGRTPSGHKTGQKLLMKDEGKLAAGTILEAAHKLQPAEVPGYLDAHFEEAWNHFDQNHEGWIYVSDMKRLILSRDT